MSGRELTAKLQQAVTAAVDGQPGLAVGPIQATRGWGDVLFVRVQAHLRGVPSDELHHLCEMLEHRLQTAVRDALGKDRTSLSVTWTYD
jgi:hypothetical protein